MKGGKKEYGNLECPEFSTNTDFPIARFLDGDTAEICDLTVSQVKEMWARGGGGGKQTFWNGVKDGVNIRGAFKKDWVDLACLLAKNKQLVQLQLKDFDGDKSAVKKIIIKLGVKYCDGELNTKDDLQKEKFALAKAAGFDLKATKEKQEAGTKKKIKKGSTAKAKAKSRTTSGASSSSAKRPARQDEEPAPSTPPKRTRSEGPAPVQHAFDMTEAPTECHVFNSIDHLLHL